MKIVLDAMGGDHAPEVTVQGAIQAAKELGVEIILTGDEGRLQALLSLSGGNGLPISIVHASQVVTMEEHTMAVKEKKDSSMVVGMRLVKQGQADAFVSAGNSGAVMAAALFHLGRIRGISRPALCTIYPAAPNSCIILDMGANTDPKPENMIQFAMMGSAYAEHVLGVARPRVAVVSNGEEPDKGSMLVRDTFPLLKASPLNFIGNAEGKDIARGIADVYLTDGFTGNVVIKLSEGIISFLFKYAGRELGGSWLNRAGLLLLVSPFLSRRGLLGLVGLALLIPTFRRMPRKGDYAEYGGAYLLGVDGVVIIAHGRSNAKAIRNAIRAATRAVDGRVLNAIKTGLTEMSAQAPAE